MGAFNQELNKTAHSPSRGSASWRTAGIRGEWYLGCFVRRVAAAAALFEKPFILAACREVFRAPNKAAKRPAFRFKQLVRDGLLVFVAGLFVAALAAGATSVRLYRSLTIPDKTYVMNISNTGLVLLDRHGREFFRFNTPGRKTVIPFADIPPHVVQALIAAEDQTFYAHAGISPTGIARAAYLDIKHETLRYGGSTITQQLVKNILLTPRKTFSRKYQEAIFALKLERQFSKEDILHMHLNTVYFGEGAHGIEEAAQAYFRKSARELTLAEGSLLIGLLPAPTALSPLSGDEAAARSRQAYVLRRMTEEGFIAEPQQTEALAAALHIQPPPPASGVVAPHFALMVHNELLQHFSKEYVVRAGLRVRTTIDLDWQSYAETQVKQHVQSFARLGASNGAAVAINPTTHEVMALVGSIDWNEQRNGKINMAVHPRQTGSAFKPIVYAAGFSRGLLTPSTILSDKPTTYGEDYRPRNYDNRYRGRVAARLALANSLNIPAVDAISQIGPASVARLAQDLGITTLSQDAPHNLSLALGSEAVSVLELTNAYAAFANSGWSAPPITVTAIEDKHGRPVPYEQPQPKRALREEVAFIVSSILSDPQARQATFGRSLNISRPAAVKTGTTQDYRDAWTVGYTPNVVVGVWMGNSDNTPMTRTPGATGAAPLWRTLMERFLEDLPDQPFVMPNGIIERRICRSHGLLAGGGGSGYPEYFISGTEPVRVCPRPSPTPDAAPPDSDVPEEVIQQAEKPVPVPPPAGDAPEA